MNPGITSLFDFSDKTVVVTGASQGIGEGVVRRFAQAGANVVIHYRGGEAGARVIADEIVAEGGAAISCKADVSIKEEVDRLVNATVDAFGQLDVMVNNAGIFPNAGFLDMSIDDWHEMYRANLDTAFLCTQAAAVQMKKSNGGAIVNMASISALNPGSDHSHYNSAKAAVVMLTRSAAQELGPSNIRVNVVSPGLIYRDGIEDQWPDGVARWKNKAPLGRMGTVTDVADACLFLASPAARFITGQNLVVDGGVMNSMIY
ncbi:MAG: SDR family oxidoreductase [Gammaproteobacteria bacterium]|nr:SDR family oxidoreductase [Gammaproteobacteria bacterium]